MRYLRFLGLLGVCLFFTSYAHAQRVVVHVGVGPAYGYVGPAPVCAYGYYGYAPYACAPYGYYGPDYFVNGVFVGAGPWYHRYYGPRGYYYGRHFYDRDDYYGHRRYWHDHDDYDRDRFHEHHGWDHDGDRYRGGYYHEHGEHHGR